MYKNHGPLASLQCQIIFFNDFDLLQELVKVKLERDRYKRDCDYKDRQIQEYHEALAEKETESMYQSSVIKELEKQLATYVRCFGCNEIHVFYNVIIQAGNGGDNNSPSDQGTKVRELEDQIAKVEDDKRMLGKAQETLQNDLRVAEVQLQVSFIIRNNFFIIYILYFFVRIKIKLFKN